MQKQKGARRAPRLLLGELAAAMQSAVEKRRLVL
jgi:hypothetical protein